MSAEQENKSRKQLSLSQESIAQGEQLRQMMRRPSFTNLVETLIWEEHKRLFPQSTTQPRLAAEPQKEQAASNEGARAEDRRRASPDPFGHYAGSVS
jgi:zona occludens toxin (predicted ATPase)